MCQCQNGADCHSVTGECICAPGFQVNSHFIMFDTCPLILFSVFLSQIIISLLKKQLFKGMRY